MIRGTVVQFCFVCNWLHYCYYYYYY